MLSFELRQKVDEILAAYKNANHFIDGLEMINESVPHMDSFLQQIAEGGNMSNSAANDLRNYLVQLKGKIIDIGPRNFFASMERFQKDLKETGKCGLDDLNIIDNITKKIDVFSEIYENYIGSYNRPLAASLTIQSRNLLSLLKGFQTALLLVKENLELPQCDIEERKELSILLPLSMGLDEFAVKLLAINEIYKELSLLLGNSIIEQPIIIQKIESGSFWVRLFGNSKVISLIVNLVNSGAVFIYRNCTNEGKLTAIPRKVQAIDSVLGLSKKLEKEGIDIKQMKDHIQKSSVCIAKELNTLLDGQPEIIINGQRHSVGEELQKKLLDLDTPLLLKYNEDEQGNANNNIKKDDN